MAPIRTPRAALAFLVTASITALAAAGCSSEDPGAVTYAGPRSGAPGLPSGNGAPSGGGGSSDTPDAGPPAPAPAADASTIDVAAPPPDASDAGAPMDAPSGPAVLSFTLLDTSVTNVVQGSPVTGQDPIKSGSSISLGTVGNNLSVRANLNVTTIGSVGFVYDGNNHTENKAPYVLCGDDGNGTINNCNLAAGTHTITATPYSDANLGGTPGTRLTITFTLTP